MKKLLNQKFKTKLQNLSFRWLWLLIGIFFGASISSMAVEKASQNANRSLASVVRLSLAAVSEEDASEKAQEMFREGYLKSTKGIDLNRVLAVKVPECKFKQGPAGLFECQSRVIYAR
jgi:hypothetical protein